MIFSKHFYFHHKTTFLISPRIYVCNVMCFFFYFINDSGVWTTAFWHYARDPMTLYLWVTRQNLITKIMPPAGPCNALSCFSTRNLNAITPYVDHILFLPEMSFKPSTASCSWHALLSLSTFMLLWKLVLGITNELDLEAVDVING